MPKPAGLVEKQLNAWAKEATEFFSHASEVLSIPNDGSRMPEIELNVKWCERTFKERGFDTQRIETPKAPLLLAEKNFLMQSKLSWFICKLMGSL